MYICVNEFEVSVLMVYFLVMNRKTARGVLCGTTLLPKWAVIVFKSLLRFHVDG